MQWKRTFNSVAIVTTHNIINQSGTPRILQMTSITVCMILPVVLTVVVVQ